ncbi:MAG: lipid II:glycine glycyltransferase FemX [Solirubrobacteraceae bacterium]
MASELVTLDPADARWQRFVAHHPDAVPFHLPGWIRSVAECYGFRAFVLALSEGGSVTAGLPVIEVPGPLRRRRWESLPFSDVCPPLLARDELADELGQALLSSSRDAGVARVHVRAPMPGLTHDEVAVTHVLDLHGDIEKGFSSAARRGTRKARREHVEVRPAASERELTHDFYELHLQTRRRLGVPVQPRRLFALLWRHVVEAGDAEVLLAHAGGRPVAGVVLLKAGRTVVYKYGASDARAWGLRPNNLLFTEALTAAARDGFERFDFGRTDHADTGLRAFKAGWGASEVPLVYAGERSGATGDSAAARVLAGAIRRGPTVVCRGLGAALYRYAA